MTDEQYRALRQLILDLTVRVEAIELHLKKQDREADARMEPINRLLNGALEEMTDEEIEFEVAAARAKSQN